MRLCCVSQQLDGDGYNKFISNVESNALLNIAIIICIQITKVILCQVSHFTLLIYTDNVCKCVYEESDVILFIL